MPKYKVKSVTIQRKLIDAVNIMATTGEGFYTEDYKPQGVIAAVRHFQKAGFIDKDIHITVRKHLKGSYVELKNNNNENVKINTEQEELNTLDLDKLQNNIHGENKLIINTEQVHIHIYLGNK